jgi:hypothetical protein
MPMNFRLFAAGVPRPLKPRAGRMLVVALIAAVVVVLVLVVVVDFDDGKPRPRVVDDDHTPMPTGAYWNEFKYGLSFFYDESQVAVESTRKDDPLTPKVEKRRTVAYDLQAVTTDERWQAVLCVSVADNPEGRMTSRQLKGKTAWYKQLLKREAATATDVRITRLNGAPCLRAEGTFNADDGETYEFVEWCFMRDETLVRMAIMGEPEYVHDGSSVLAGVAGTFMLEEYVDVQTPTN